MLVNITLTEEEQDFLVSLAGRKEIGDFASPRTAASIAGKVRRAQEDVWASGIPADDEKRQACGLCGVAQDVHDAPDHYWQWLVSTTAQCSIGCDHAAGRHVPAKGIKPT